MGYMKEKVAYLKGLAEGMNIGGEGQGKLLNAMISTMDEMADAIDENEAAMAEIDECLDDIYDELDNIDDYLSTNKTDHYLRHSGNRTKYPLGIDKLAALKIHVVSP